MAFLVLMIPLVTFWLNADRDGGDLANRDEVVLSGSEESAGDSTSSLQNAQPNNGPGMDSGEAQLARHLDERAYRVSLDVAYPSGEKFVWRGTSVVAPALHNDAVIMSGIVMPNRWIVVPLKAVENAKQIWVRYEGVTYEAQVRSRLTKLDFATLQIDRSEKFPRPICDRENQMEWNSKNMKIIYRDESARLRTVPGCDVVAKKDDVEYRIDGRTIPDTAIGGLVLHDSGRIAGLVNRRSAGNVILTPWSRVGQGWGENRGAGLFDYETPLFHRSEEDASLFHGEYLVQVIVIPEQVSGEPEETKFLFDTRVSGDPVSPGAGFASWSLPADIRCNSAKDFELVDSSRRGLQLQSIYPENFQQWTVPPQLPFLLGSPGRLAIEAIPDPKADTWKSSRKVSVKLHDECTIREKGSQSKAFEIEFVEEEDWEVIGRDSNNLKLRRRLRLYPFAIDRRKNFKIEGEELVTVSLRDSFILEREYNGRFVQSDDPSSTHEATIHFLMERLRGSDVMLAPAYWRVGS